MHSRKVKSKFKKGDTCIMKGKSGLLCKGETVKIMTNMGENTPGGKDTYYSAENINGDWDYVEEVKLKKL